MICLFLEFDITALSSPLYLGYHIGAQYIFVENCRCDGLTRNEDFLRLL